MNTTNTLPHEILKHIHPGGVEAFKSLPCCYGAKAVPRSPVLRGMALCHVALPPNGETRLFPKEKGHYHRRLMELYFFTGGSGRMMLNGVWREVCEGTVAEVPPMVMHTTRAGNSGLEFVVWTYPAYDPADSFALFDYPAEFSRHEPAWVKESPNGPPSRSIEVTILHEAADWELGFARLSRGAAVPAHVHARAEESYFILAGEAVVTVETTTSRAARGTMVSLPARTRHSIAAGPDGVCYCLMATPPVPGGECVAE